MDISALYRIYQQHSSVQTDTRKLQPGDLFFALKGPSFDGNTFVLSALEKGAAFAVTDDITYAGHEQCIVVPDALETLQELARYHRQQFNIPFIAITGSNGKTTTKELVTAVLKQQYRTYATVGNLNNHIGVPLTLLSIPADAEMAVIEMGANHRYEIQGYCQVALPTHGLITNCGKAHIEGFGSLEGVRLAKGELYDYIRETGGSIFRNTDLDYLEQMAHGIPVQITYGTKHARYSGTPVMDDIFLHAAVTIQDTETILRTHLVGSYNFPNVMAAVAVGLHFGIPIASISEALTKYNPDNSRSQWLQRGANKVILDAYNANPTSMAAAIQNFAAATLPKKQLWLGGMKEMGATESEEHAALIALIDQHPWERVILVGPEFKARHGKYHWYPDAAAAADFIKINPPENASILIKGSRGSRMEILLEALPA